MLVLNAIQVIGTCGLHCSFTVHVHQALSPSRRVVGSEPSQVNGLDSKPVVSNQLYSDKMSTQTLPSTRARQQAQLQCRKKLGESPPLPPAVVAARGSASRHSSVSLATVWENPGSKPSALAKRCWTLALTASPLRPGRRLSSRADSHPEAIRGRCSSVPPRTLTRTLRRASRG